MARSLAPDLEIREVGIRPGEKLHEQMITRDDGRQTIVLKDPLYHNPAIQFLV